MAEVVKWLTRSEAAAFLTDLGYRISERTLANLAANNNAGRGPSYTKFMRLKGVRYDAADLTKWLDDQKIRVA